VRLLVCGSRTWDDPDPISAVIVGYRVLARQRAEAFALIHGSARSGADSLAHVLAHRWGVAEIAVPADWRQHGRSAGPRRNQRMLDEHHPDVVFAFRSEGESRGTDDMIDRAQRAGVPIYVVRSLI
jgi:hypothetical protein